MRRSRSRPSTKDANAGLRKQLLEIPHRDYSPIIIVIIILLFIKGGGNLYSTSLWPWPQQRSVREERCWVNAKTPLCHSLVSMCESMQPPSSNIIEVGLDEEDWSK